MDNVTPIRPGALIPSFDVGPPPDDHESVAIQGDEIPGWIELGDEVFVRIDEATEPQLAEAVVLEMKRAATHLSRGKAIDRYFESRQQ